MCRPYQLLFVNHWIAVKIIWTYLDARKQYLHTVTVGAKHKSITSRNNMVCKCLANGFWMKFEPQRLSCTSSRSNPFAAILAKHLQRPIYAQLLLDTGSLLITSDCCPRHLLGHWFLRKWTKKACIKMGPTANKTKKKPGTGSQKSELGPMKPPQFGAGTIVRQPQCLWVLHMAGSPYLC